MRAARASKYAASAKMPKSSSAHVPTEIGDQYLKLKPPLSGVVLIIICQKRSGWPRSTVSSIAHATNSGNATKYPVRAVASSAGAPHRRIMVAIV